MVSTWSNIIVYMVSTWPSATFYMIPTRPSNIVYMVPTGLAQQHCLHGPNNSVYMISTWPNNIVYMIPTWPNTVYMAPTWPHFIVYMILSTCSFDTDTVSAPYLVQPMDIAVFLPVAIESHTTYSNESLLVYVPVISIYYYIVVVFGYRPVKTKLLKSRALFRCVRTKSVCSYHFLCQQFRSGLSQVMRSKYTEGRTVCSHLKPFSGQTVCSHLKSFSGQALNSIGLTGC